MPSSATISNATSTHHDPIREKLPCRYGRNCRDKNKPEHCAKYSHPPDVEVNCKDDQDGRPNHDSTRKPYSTPACVALVDCKDDRTGRLKHEATHKTYAPVVRVVPEEAPASKSVFDVSRLPFCCWCRGPQ